MALYLVLEKKKCIYFQFEIFEVVWSYENDFQDFQEMIILNALG